MKARLLVHAAMRWSNRQGIHSWITKDEEATQGFFEDNTVV
jgi:hypothetical protein